MLGIKIIFRLYNLFLTLQQTPTTLSILQPTDGRIIIPVAQLNLTLNMSCYLEHKTGQLQGNGLKIMMCYIPLVTVTPYIPCHSGQERNCLVLPTWFKVS
jgi:hypothetical protein